MALRTNPTKPTISLYKCVRAFSARPKVVLDESVNTNIENEDIKPRKHPGIMLPKTVIIPDSFIKAAIKTTEDFPIKSILRDSEVMVRHLKNRVPPMENDDKGQLKQQIVQQVLYKMKNVEITSEEQDRRVRDSITAQVDNRMRKKVYNWQPIKFDTYTSLVYLFGRSAAEYAVLVKIFSEIASRDPTFKPRSLFDFGSGVGTVTWAANMFWKKHFFEYFNVDSSRDMSDLALTLLQGGKGNGLLPIKGVFYRQFLPSQAVAYDLVVSAYSLLELPSLNARLQTVLNLWNKTSKYLVIVEQGTNAGFKVVNEIRDFILQIDKENCEGHVFSPCPHDKICPRFVADDGTPCNYAVNYKSLPVGSPSTHITENYSYVVLRKGKRDSSEEAWPRVVREVLVRSRHSICRMCTANGDLKEVIFTKAKHGKTTYHCARATKWGDLLPITISEAEAQIENEDEVCETNLPTSDDNKT